MAVAVLAAAVVMVVVAKLLPLLGEKVEGLLWPLSIDNRSRVLVVVVVTAIAGLLLFPSLF